MKKNLLVFTSVDCPPCVSTKKLIDELVGRNDPRLSNLSCVQYKDVDSNMTESCKFGVRTVPTLFTLDPTSHAVIARHNGGLTNPSELVKLLNAD